MSNQTFISVGPYWDIIYRHRRSFFITIVVGLILTGLSLFLIPKQYTSSVMLEVWHSDVQPSLIGAEPQNNANVSHIESRLEALSEETIARGHLQELIAKHDLYLRNGKPQPGAAGEMAGAITITIPDAVLQSKTPNRFQRSLPPDAVEISYEYTDPAKAQAVANDLGNIMIDEYRKELERHNAETIKLISSEVDETRGKLAESQAQIKVLKEKYRGSLPQDLDDNVRALEALQMQVERTASGEAKTDATDGTVASVGPRANTPEAALAALKTKLVALTAQYSNEYPEVIETKSQIEVLEKEIANPVRAQSSSSHGSGSAASQIQQQIADYQHRIADTPSHEEAVAAVNRDYAILSSRYHDLSNLLFQATADEEVLERGQGERLKVMQPGGLPLNPSFPNRLALIGGGVALTLLIALAIPFGLFYTDTSFKDSDDIKAEFADVNAIAISRVPEVERLIDVNAAEAPIALPENGATSDSGGIGPEQSTNGDSASQAVTNGSLVPLTGRAARFAQRYPAPPLVAAGEDMVTTAADEFQLLAFKLRSWAAQHDRAKVFVVASAVGGEGKSFVALNLAAALAVSGSGALLIDADIRAPFQHYAFPVPKVDGLLGYLQGSVELASTILPTPVPGLSLMPSGGTSNRAPEYLASTRMDLLMETMRKSTAYQYIIIDTPPALLVPDAQILARGGDGTIVVTAADSTARAATTKTFMMFDPQSLFGVVLNRFKPSLFHRAQRALWPLWTLRADTGATGNTRNIQSTRNTRILM